MIFYLGTALVDVDPGGISYTAYGDALHTRGPFY